MANSMKKTTKSQESAVNPVVDNVTEVDADIVNEAVEEIKAEPKRFAQDDLIPCKSITAGELLMVGERTKMLYRWADTDDIQEVEYQDLIYAARSNSGFVFKPRFIIMDKDFVAQNPKVQEKYDTMYTNKDLRDIIMLSPKEIKKIVPTLPEGAKESLKSMASTMIDNGVLDSVARIKVLDELFDTNMMLKTNLL
jgi:hypothetical protein